VILHEFQYKRPRSLAEAASLLADMPEARPMAGGTDLLPNIRVAVCRPPTVIGLGAIAAPAPRLESDGTIRIDALSRLTTLAESPLLQQRAPMLAEAARAVGSHQIREMGTLGGNLCQDTRCLQFNQQHDFQFVAPCYKRGGCCCYPVPQNKPGVCWSVYMSDIAPALISLGARLEIVDRTRTRQMPVEELFTGDGMRPANLVQGELISAVLVPLSPANFGWGYHKSARRGGLEFATSVAAVALRIERGLCAQPRIVVGAVRERPVRALDAERLLAGKPMDAELLASAAAAAATEVKPLPHHGFTKNFIVDNLRVHLRRILSMAVERATAAAA
jgi:CO/xanthine dehydrogenase FAD-binding subunit